jgi:hypothetical protein
MDTWRPVPFETTCLWGSIVGDGAVGDQLGNPDGEKEIFALRKK